MAFVQNTKFKKRNIFCEIVPGIPQNTPKKWETLAKHLSKIFELNLITANRQERAMIYASSLWLFLMLHDASYFLRMWFLCYYDAGRNMILLFSVLKISKRILKKTSVTIKKFEPCFAAVLFYIVQGKWCRLHVLFWPHHCS